MIDVLRMEKFLLLCRRYVAANFEGLKKGKWKEEDVLELLQVYEEVPLNVEDHRLPNGLRYHIIDVWVDEIERAGVLGMEEDERDGVLELLLRPLETLRKKSPTKTVREKAKEALADERLPGNAKVESEGGKDEDEDGGEVWGGFDD